MTRAVEITRRDLDAVGLRRAGARSADSAAARRMLGLALVLEGRSRHEAASAWGMDRQSLRDWVIRYNAAGVAGPCNKRAPGSAAKLSADQAAVVAGWVRAGPELSADGVVRWRRIDLAHKIEQEWGVRLAERSVGDLLRGLGFRRLSVRPRHPKQEAAAQEAHKKNFADLVTGAVPEHAKGTPLELWWQDEARVGQQGTLTYVWAEKGSRPRAPRDQRRQWAYLFGAVCPARAVGAALVLPCVNAKR